MIGADQAFSFDYAFAESVSQDTLYETCVAHLVTGCFEGYNATVLAYGQTGSGKTHTMGSGNCEDVDDEELGIIPRVISQIFQRWRHGTRMKL